MTIRTFRPDGSLKLEECSPDQKDGHVTILDNWCDPYRIVSYRFHECECGAELSVGGYRVTEDYHVVVSGQGWRSERQSPCREDCQG